MPKKRSDGQAAKMQWVITNFFKKGKSRPEAVKGLIDEFGCRYNYARTIVYNLLCHLEWARAPYPKNRRARKSKDMETLQKLKEKFKVPTMAAEQPATDDEFDF